MVKKKKKKLRILLLLGQTFLSVLTTSDVLLSSRSHSSLKRNTVLLRPVHAGHTYESLSLLPVQWLPKCLNSQSQVENQIFTWEITQCFKRNFIIIQR